MHQQTIRWTRKRMNFTINCETLLQAAVFMIWFWWWETWTLTGVTTLTERRYWGNLVSESWMIMGKVMWPLWYEWLSCNWNSFLQKEIHKLTWKSPGGKTVNQLDHVFVNGRMRTSILDTRVMGGADVYGDYYLVRTRMRLKLAKAHGKKKTSVRFDVC